MTVHEAVSRGYRLEKIGSAWLLTLKGLPLNAAHRPEPLLGFAECHGLVRDTLRHGLKAL